MDKYAVATFVAKTGEQEVGGRWAGALHVTGTVTITDKFGQEHICPYWADMEFILGTYSQRQYGPNTDKYG